MGKESENKAERILSIYTRLKQGKVIYKEKESKVYGVSSRTIQRDITDVQCFLQNRISETGEIQEIVFDKHSGGYVLQTKSTNRLDRMEIYAIAKILIDSRVLMKRELFSILHKLIRICSGESDMGALEELIRGEMQGYEEPEVSSNYILNLR